MRTLILVISFCVSCMLLLAQSPNAARFHWEIGSNIGLMPTFAKDRPDMLTLPVSLYVDRRISGNFSLSAVGGHSRSGLVRNSSITGEPLYYENDYSFVGLRASAHTSPHRFDRWDVYGGLSAMLVFSEVSVSKLIKSESSAVSTKDYNKFLITGFLGARFALNRRWGVQGELGFGAALLNAGISYRFAKSRK
jgi:hypothetical protein